MFYHLCTIFGSRSFLRKRVDSDGSSDLILLDTGQTFMITNLSLIFDIPFDSRPYILDFNIEYLKNNKVESIKDPGNVKEEILKNKKYENRKNLSEKTLLGIYYAEKLSDNDIRYIDELVKTSNNGEDSLYLTSKTLPDEFFH